LLLLREIYRRVCRALWVCRVLKNERNCACSILLIERSRRRVATLFVGPATTVYANFLERNNRMSGPKSDRANDALSAGDIPDGSDEIISYTAENHGAAFDFGAVSKYWSPAEAQDRLRKGYLWLSGNTVMVSRSRSDPGRRVRPEAALACRLFHVLGRGAAQRSLHYSRDVAAIRQRASTYSSVGMSNRREQRATLGGSQRS